MPRAASTMLVYIYKLEDIFDIETVRRNSSGIESAGPSIGRALTLEIAASYAIL